MDGVVEVVVESGSQRNQERVLGVKLDAVKATEIAAEDGLGHGGLEALGLEAELLVGNTLALLVVTGDLQGASRSNGSSRGDGARWMH